MALRVLVIGGGGREHAIAWKLARSDRVSQVFVAPGNAGTLAEPGVENLPVAADDFPGLLAFVEQHDIDLTVVGPEGPLVAGIVDQFERVGRRIFGPHKAAARLEGSKAFSKEFLMRHAIPTAAYGRFTDITAARAYVTDHGAPIVIKADGLAAGKGVVVAQTVAEAERALDDMLVQNAYGTAGSSVVIEEFLAGEEASFICIVGGGHILPLASSQDHKARDDGDVGPNTGGMGAYSPAPVVDAQMHARIMQEIIEPTVAGLASDGMPYTGFLYAGIMIDPRGVPRVLEFNCRFGDPETQPILMRLESDLCELCLAALDGTLADHAARWDPRTALGVVMASGGYPETYRNGDPITGLDAYLADTKVFHAGTVAQEGQTLTKGGRVLCVCALGDSVAEAKQLAYQRVAGISWTDVFYRNDIGYRALD